MTFKGHVKDGVVVPEEGNALPEGARVVIQIVGEMPAEETPEKTKEKPRERAIMKFAGMAKDLPPDASENVDHYL